jgi:hypothetical protein
MEEEENIEDFLGWLEIIIKQLKGMNNNSFDYLFMITNIMHVYQPGTTSFWKHFIEKRFMHKF